nr:hypothetical protein [uncultured Lachnoclostridium sp.]
MKITKIQKRDLVSNVQAQSSDCKTDCKVKVWAGKKEADGNAAGCWYTYQYTARWNPLA